jgi:hypothetical protein
MPVRSQEWSPSFGPITRQSMSPAKSGSAAEVAKDWAGWPAWTAPPASGSRSPPRRSSRLQATPLPQPTWLPTTDDATS